MDLYQEKYLKILFYQSIFNLIKNNKILEKVSKILGQEISSNPCQNSRIKQPEKAISKKNLHDGLVGRTPLLNLMFSQITILLNMNITTQNK